MDTRVKISTTADKVRYAAIAIGLITLFCVSARSLNLDIIKFSARLANAPKVLARMMALDFSNLAAIYQGMLASVLIAVVALSMGVAISLPLSFLAAGNIAPNKGLAAAIKGGIAVIRAVPALIWILMVVASYGFGSTGGMVGLIFPTVGYLVKSFTASIEDLGMDLIEAMRATGAGRLAIIAKALLPSLVGPFLSWTAIRLESNIAESISLGMVGIGGIGSLLTRAIGKYDYGTVSMVILVIFSTMFMVELLVSRVKQKL